VKRTGDIGFFKITEESSLSSGVRRIFAHTGTGALRYVTEGFRQLTKLQQMLNVPVSELESRIRQLLEKNRELEKKLRKRSGSGGAEKVTEIINNTLEVNGRKLAISEIESDDIDHLKLLGDHLASGLGSGIGVLASIEDSKLTLVFVVTQDLIVAGVKAGDIAREQGKKLGGGGGGQPHLATAGLKYSGSVSKALDDMKVDLTELLEGINE
jgi:alanyl-tRNA synthetase